MNGQTKTARIYDIPISALLTVFFLVFASGTTMAQVPVDEDGNTIPAYSQDDLDVTGAAKPAIAIDAILSSSELEALVGPIALYPDDLLAIVLPASTYPLEIVQAARFLERLESDSSLTPDEDWDDSIIALLNYPEVVRMMDEDIDWTWRLGEAVIGQQSEVIAAVESFRDRAYAAGNLKSDENQTVTYDEGIIEIIPIDEEIIYVPYYEPEEVVVYQPRPVYHYYPNPYPSYYYPYPLGYRFGSGYFWGVTTAFSIGWHNQYLHVYHPTYWGHPYYGHNYYGHYYRYPSIGVYNSWYVNNSYYTSHYNHRDGDYWRPHGRAGSRQDEPRVRNYYYPPGGDQRRRQDYSARNQLNNRDNGRLSLNLRERSEADRNRVAIDNRGWATISRNDNTRSSESRNTSGAVARSQGNRTSSNSGATPRVDGGNNRNRVSASNSRVSSNQARNAGSRPEIQFSDRSSNNRRSSSQFAVRSSDNITSSRPSQGRISFAPRPSTSANTSSSRGSRQVATQQRVTPTTRATAPRATARASAPAPRASAPRTSAPRPTAPRASAPRPSAPRASAPRSSAPRASAPRSSAPRASAPRSSAPRASSGSSHSSAPRSSSGSRSSSSSRARRRSN